MALPAANPVLEPAPLAPMQRTEGSGQLRLEQELGQLRLKVLFQKGSAKLKLLPSPDRRSTDIVLINTAGGLTGGDDLKWSLDIGAGVTAAITTQACEKIYKSNSGAARVHSRLKIGAGAHTSWLPQETILFNQAHLQRQLEVDLGQGAHCLICEPVIFGRQHMGESYLKGEMTDRWQIRQNGKLLHLEAARLTPASLIQNSGFNGAGAAATVLLISPRAEAVFAQLKALKTPETAMGFWSGKLMLRLLAPDGYTLRKRLFPLLRVLNNGAPLPKVWSL